MRTLAVRKWVSVRVSMLACCCDSGEREHVLTVCDVWVCVCVFMCVLYIDIHVCLFILSAYSIHMCIACTCHKFTLLWIFQFHFRTFSNAFHFVWVSESVRRIRTFSTNQVYLHRVYAAIAMQSFVSIRMSSAFGMCLSVGYVLVYARSIAF